MRKCKVGSIALFVGEKGRWKMPLRGKVQERDFSTSLGNPARTAGFPLLPPPLRRLRRVEILMFA
jgi:hypothetical protein